MAADHQSRRQFSVQQRPTRPFRAGNLAKLLHQIVYATPPPIHTLREDVPEDLEVVVATAMQKDPERRQKSGLELAGELTRVHQQLRQALVQWMQAKMIREEDDDDQYCR